MHAPLESHLNVALRVLRYLKGSPGNGIQINKNGNLKLRAYADSDWARRPVTRKSVSGYCVFWVIHWLLGKVKNNLLFLDPQKRPSTEVWLLVHMKLFGCVIFLVTWGLVNCYL